MTKKHITRNIALCLLLFALLSCKRVGHLTLPSQDEGGGGTGGGGETQLHYFFDRTESMKGFAAKGDKADYVEALNDIWEAAETFPSLDAHFYEFGETWTHEFNSIAAINQVRRELNQGSFYGGNQKSAGGIRTMVKQNNGQPFSAVADYVKTQSADDNNVYVIVTDFYEQGRDDPFSRLYREAFSRGLSGALFAIESSFSGTIYSISRVDVGGAAVNVRDGYSTFFVCVVGESRALYKYCASLEKELSRGSPLKFYSAVFMVNSADKIDIAANLGEQVMAGNPKRFGADDNAFNLVNLRKEAVRIIGEGGGGGAIESYQMLTNTGSRWAAGLALSNINTDNFSYTSVFSLSSNESGSNPRDEEPLVFKGIANSTDVSVKLVTTAEVSEPPAGMKSNIPLYLAIEAKNSRLKKGWYNIKYSIVPEALPLPEWVTAINAKNITELQESAKGQGARVKTLQFANVYEKIAEAYNALKSRSIYKDEIYLLKR